MQDQDVNIGGVVRERRISEALSLLPMNKTLMVTKLTNDPEASPEIVQDLRTVEDVFEHYKPSVEVKFTDKDENEVDEELNFSTVGDFGVKGLMKQSKFLKKLQEEKNELFRFTQILKSNKVLSKILQNPEEKQAYIASLKNILAELETTKSE